MKNLIASVLLTIPALVLAATPAAPNKAASNKASAASTAVNKKAAAVKKTTPVKKTAAARAPAPARNTAAKAGAVAATGGAAVLGARALNADELALADRVHTGHIGCELGQHVNVSKDEKNPGHFLITGKGFNFHMAPVGTSTGVVRLEDEKAGAVWLQIANKSMLMNQKQGKRLADECMSPEQLQVADAIKKTPPQSLLDAPGK
ncbi:MAG: hypothetical protein KBT18_12255 [Comamonas sp.]|nr:hypothetical protein [Candidatus Comamonas equi]